MGLKVYKTNELPQVLQPDAMYMVSSGSSDVKIYITDKTATVARFISGSASVAAFSQYSLPITTGTGVIDLSTTQIYKVDLSAAGTKTISFTNPPAKAMTIIIEAVGNTGTISFPASVVNTTGIDTALGVVKTIFVLFWDTEKYYLVNVAKVDV